MTNFQWGLVFLIGGLAAMGAFGYLDLAYQMGRLSWSGVFEDLGMWMILPMIGGPVFFWAVRPLLKRAKLS